MRKVFICVFKEFRNDKRLMCTSIVTWDLALRFDDQSFDTHRQF